QRAGRERAESGQEQAESGQSGQRRGDRAERHILFGRGRNTPEKEIAIKRQEKKKGIIPICICLLSPSISKDHTELTLSCWDRHPALCTGTPTGCVSLGLLRDRATQKTHQNTAGEQ
uniref:Uncharacterized protein n=1 Tax=Otus sunia TaxID=257818 RepID=A0A8C8A9X9_9STRI